MKKRMLFCLSVVIAVMMMVTVVSLAKSNDEKKPVTDAKSNVVKQLTNGSLADGDFSKFIKKQQKKSVFHKNGYSDPVADSRDYLKVYYPEPGSIHYLGESMNIELSVTDTWKYFFTRPVSGLFDPNNNLVETKPGDVASAYSTTTYSGSFYLDPAKYQPGRYHLFVCNAPCYSSGNLVDGWSSWDNVPAVSIYFEIRCNHAWDSGVVTRYPTYTAAGEKTFTCSMCHQKRTESIPKLNKIANTMTVKASKKTLKFKVLKKKAVTIKPVAVRSARGKVSYTVVGGNAKSKKALSLNKNNGKIKVRKSTKKGTYFIKVKVSAAGDYMSLPSSKTVKAVVKVK